jgi:hypothetical protein
MACCWQQLVGNRAYPGLLHLALGIAQRHKLVIPCWRAATRGRDLATQLNKTLGELPLL